MNSKYRVFLHTLVLGVVAATSCIAAVQGKTQDNESRASKQKDRLWEPNDVVDLLQEPNDLSKVLGKTDIVAAQGKTSENVISKEPDSVNSDHGTAAPVARLSVAGSGISTGSLRRKVPKGGISHLQRPSRSKDELERMIKLIRSIKFVRRLIPPEPAPTEVIPQPAPDVEITRPAQQETSEAARPLPLPQAGQAEMVQPAPEPPSDSEKAPALPYQPVKAETIRKLETLRQDGGRIENPAAVARTLFLSGNLEEAAAFYQLALERVGAGQAELDDKDKAWMLFQTGNCLRGDREVAKKVYQQLMSQYPNSQWCPVADAYVKLIDWYQKDKPLSLIMAARATAGESVGKSDNE